MVQSIRNKCRLNNKVQVKRVTARGKAPVPRIRDTAIQLTRQRDTQVDKNRAVQYKVDLMTQPLAASQFDGAYGIFTVRNKFPNAIPMADTKVFAAQIMVNSNTIPPPIERPDLTRFLEFYSEPVKTIINRELKSSPLKLFVTMHLHLYNNQSKHIDAGELFNVNRTTVTNEADIREFIEKVLLAFDKMVEKRYMTVFALLDFNIHFCKYNPFARAGSSYMPTPMVSNKRLKGIVNIKILCDEWECCGDRNGNSTAVSVVGGDRLRV